MQAEEIMRFALFKEVPKRQRRKKRKYQNGVTVRKGDEDAEGGSDEESDEESGNETEEQRMSTPPTAKDQIRDPIWGEDSQDVQMEVEPQPGPSAAPISAAPAADGKIRPDRFVDPPTTQ
jgi:DNA replication licensing factor MCM3